MINKKKTLVKYISNELGRLVQGVVDILKSNDTIFPLEHEKYQQIGEKTSRMSNLFAITDSNRTNLNGQYLWQGTISSNFQEISVQEQKI